MSNIFLSNQEPQAFAAPPAIEAQRNPGDGDKGYSIGQIWCNVATQAAFILMGYTNGLPVWEGLGSTAGGSITGDDITITPGPSSFTGVFEVIGNVNQNEVIKISENAVGGLGTVTIESVAGTSSDSILLHSVSGGIEVTTDVAGGDIAITSALGRVTIGAGEDIADAIQLEVGGGVLSGITLLNTAGTGVDSVQLNSTLGGIEVLTFAAGKDIVLASDLGSIALASGENTANSIILESSGGVLSTVAISNTAGTNDASVLATASIHMVSDLGGVGIQAGKDFFILGDTTSTAQVTTGDLRLITDNGNLQQTATLGNINLLADAGDVNIEATLGALNFTAGAGISYSVTGAINLDATLTSHFTVTGAAQDVIISSVGGSAFLESDEAVANAIRINASDAAGGIDIDAGTGSIDINTTGAFSIDGAAASNVTTTGAGIDLTLSSSLGSVIVTASEAAVNAVQITASDVAGGLDLNAGTGGVTLDTTGAFSIDGAASSNITLTGAFDLTVDSSAGSVIVNGGEAVLDAIQLTTTNAAGGIDINAGTGGMTLDSTGLISIDAAGAANFTTTGAFDLTLNSTAGSVIVQGAEAVNDAVQISASNAAGGVLVTGGTAGNVSIASVSVATAAPGPAATASATNNARVGSVTFSGYTQAASTTMVLTLTNSFITASSCILATATNVGANDAQMNVSRIFPGASTADITIVNNGAAALNGDMQLNFWVLS
jgi:hypothetical protein